MDRRKRVPRRARGGISVGMTTRNQGEKLLGRASTKPPALLRGAERGTLSETLRLRGTAHRTSTQRVGRRRAARSLWWLLLRRKSGGRAAAPHKIGVAMILRFSSASLRFCPSLPKCLAGCDGFWRHFLAGRTVASMGKVTALAGLFVALKGFGFSAASGGWGAMYCCEGCVSRRDGFWFAAIRRLDVEETGDSGFGEWMLDVGEGGYDAAREFCADD